MRKHITVTMFAGLFAAGMCFAQKTDQSANSRQGANYGQTTTTSQGSANRATNGSNAMADHSFVTKAAQGGLAEVELGNLAESKASSPAVKQFAQRMVSDHTKANDQLKSIASKDNIQLPTTMDAKDRAEKDRLDKLTGADFDRAYMRYMVSDHRNDVSEFQHEADNGKNPDVKEWAGKTLPVLQEHLTLAQQTDQQVRNGSNGTSARRGTNQ